VEIVTTNLENCLNDVLKQYKSCFEANLGLQVLQQLKFESSTKRAVSNLLLSHLIKVESLASGASDLMLGYLFEDRIFDVDNDNCQKLNKENLKNLISTYVDVSLKDMTYEALCIAGLNGKVVLTKQQTQQDSDILELNDGSFFPEVISIFKLKNSKYLNPRIACIDGYIESVSEIHHLLEEASRLKENIFLFVRGISDEVVHTLKVNYDRGTLTVLPFIVKYDLDGVNLLNDIAIVTGGDVISSLKGQLISSVKLSTCHRVDYINVSDAGVLIEKLETRNKVNEHVHFLQKKLLELNEDTSKEFIAKRIKNLGSNRVTISLKLDHNATKKSFMIDRALRATKVAATHGVVEINNKLYPLATFNIAKTYYNLFLKEYRDLGAIIS
jgi:chaperonin GroEL (HSP60 family)